MHGAKT